MRRLILASHGRFAEGIKDSANLIVGNLADMIETYCLLPGQLATDYANQLEKEVKAKPEDEFVIVVDIYGASVFSAMFPLTQYANVHLITGLNLAIVLSLLLSYPEKLTQESITNIIQEGQKSIKHVTQQSAMFDEDDDF
ncbi:MAG: hypothetical protein MR210_01340 [Erysipelotrichaceae bacterium]|nr:hypothetical protein [Erysipelotrichaceae bacterium]MDY5251426.1 hypothetical protein [Erysipelotrichaceae bacterium]